MEKPKTTRGGTQGLLPDGFDVTCVIGRVYLGMNGDDTPHEAAFKLIASHDAPGTYTFPMFDGRECVVTVDYSGEGDAPYSPND